ncbi:hypothetical protein Q604_UNBC12231G0002 [human gut metagenome]|jgi:hypothetical protein|uniref:DUF2442 domain-containing protein n=1 Tax=human gut metagenome TaxID=408170 RepID=W1XTA2_9ZZZZ|nr:DUF2442 domain-containing protein [Clostridium butyricum]MDU5821848.1 DUF2442 domain-containing protein [Clostridium butyricum]
MERDIYDSKVKINMPIKVIPLEDYHLYIEYEDGKSINFDMSRLLNHPLFKPLNDKYFFDLVKINGSSISWPNDIDLCADSLYDSEVTCKL